jgi:hypothetical protein
MALVKPVGAPLKRVEMPITSEKLWRIIHGGAR